MMRTPLVMGLAIAALAAPARATAQTPLAPPPAQTTQTPARPPTQAAEATPEAADLAAGWAALSQKDAARAAATAAAVLGEHPRSVAAVDLLVSAEIALGGSASGLAAYEQWLGPRHLDDAYALRTVALATLQEAAANLGAPGARREAFDALAADGDTQTLVAIARGASAGGLGETALLAKLGSESAIRALIAQLTSESARKLTIIQELGATRSPLATTPLTNLLKDLNPDIRAAAADALGTLGATDAAPALQPLLKDTIFSVHFAAASALLRLHDTSGLAFLRELESSEHPAVRASALGATAVQPDATWVALVTALLQDPDPQVRLKAAGLIAATDIDAARRTIDRLLTDGNIAIREAASQVYINQIASDFRQLRGLLRADPLARVRAAARILALTR